MVKDGLVPVAAAAATTDEAAMGVGLLGEVTAEGEADVLAGEREGGLLKIPAGIGTVFPVLGLVFPPMFTLSLVVANNW